MSRVLAAAFVLSAAIFPLLGADRPIAFAPEVMGWTDGPPSLPKGSQMAVLEGHPAEEGMFTMRVRVPAGSVLAPHWHPRDERVTVLSGAVELGFGNTADRTRVARYETGSFYVNPPRVAHYLFFPEETVLQLTGMGPWEIHPAEGQPEEPASGTVTLRSADPPALSVLGDARNIVATVDYEIENFRPATYFLSMQFESTVPNQSFSASATIAAGDKPLLPSRPHGLTAERGTYTLEQDLEGILGRPNLKRPVRFRIFLHEATDDDRSRVVATTDWVEYR